MTKPQIVLAPAAWHSADCFRIIVPKLEAAGYTVHLCHMPSVDNDNPPEDLTEDIAALEAMVTKAIGDGNDVIVAPHSWAGFIAGSGLLGFGKKQREARGEKGGVIRAAYMCAYIVPEGICLIDARHNKFPPWAEIEGKNTTINSLAANIWYGDLPEDERMKWLGETKRHAMGSLTAESTATSWKEIPTSYLLCEDDKTIPAFSQGIMADGVKSMGGEIEVVRLKSDHSPFISHPDEVVNWLRRVAGETL